MAVLELTTSQKSVCAIPDPGVEGESEWEVVVGGDLLAIEDIAEDSRSATVVANDGTEGGVSFVTVTTEVDELTVIATLEVRVAGKEVRFADVSASTPDLKTEPESRERKEPSEPRA